MKISRDHPRSDVPDNMTPDRPNWRMPAGIALMLLWIVVWTAAVSEGVGRLEPLPQWARVVLYLVGGIIWILPLRPLMLWMNRGTISPTADLQQR